MARRSDQRKVILRKLFDSIPEGLPKLNSPQQSFWLAIRLFGFGLLVGNILLSLNN